MGSLTAVGSFRRTLCSICGPAPGCPVVLWSEPLDPPFSASLSLLAQWKDSVDFLVNLPFLKDSPEGTGLEQFYLFIFKTLLGSWTL